MPPRAIELDHDLAVAVAAHCARRHPREFVGLVAGWSSPERLRVADCAPLDNTALGDDRFTVDPIAFARAEAKLRARGHGWLGFVHSHPRGTAAPSRTDHLELWRDCVHLIVAGAELRAFWYRGEECLPLPVRMSAPPGNS